MLFAGDEFLLAPALTERDGEKQKRPPRPRPTPALVPLGEHVVRLALRQLSTVPDAVWSKTSLRTLVLTGNCLTSLPAALGGLTALEKLLVGSNQLVALPAEVGQLARLKELRCEANALEDVPPQLALCAELRSLDLSGNPLVRAPPEVQELWAAGAAAASVAPAERCARTLAALRKALPAEERARAEEAAKAAEVRRAASALRAAMPLADVATITERLQAYEQCGGGKLASGARRACEAAQQLVAAMGAGAKSEPPGSPGETTDSGAAAQLEAALAAWDALAAELRLRRGEGNSRRVDAARAALRRARSARTFAEWRARKSRDALALSAEASRLSMVSVGGGVGGGVGMYPEDSLASGAWSEPGGKISFARMRAARKGVQQGDAAFGDAAFAAWKQQKADKQRAFEDDMARWRRAERRQAKKATGKRAAAKASGSGGWAAPRVTIMTAGVERAALASQRAAAKRAAMIAATNKRRAEREAAYEARMAAEVGGSQGEASAAVEAS